MESRLAGLVTVLAVLAAMVVMRLRMEGRLWWGRERSREEPDEEE